MAIAVRTDEMRLSEYATRRQKVFKALDGAVGLVLAGEGSPPLLGKWRPDFNFYYLTGISTESGAAVLFDPTADDPKRRCVLFLRPLNSELERWDGYRHQISQALKDETGFETVMRTSALPRALTTAARRCKRLACLHPFAVYPELVSPDLELFRKVSERMPEVRIEDQTNLLPSMRAVKSSAELSLMRKAVVATEAGYEAVVKMIRPGVTETEIAHTLEEGYRSGGATGLAYNHIVGAGINGTVLHYMQNTAKVEAGDLIVIDSAAEYAQYAADVTRTYPVGGRFTSDQREVYEVVLEAQLAAIKAARVGVKMTEVDAAARKVIEKAGYGDTFIHGIGHQLGIEVHDVTPDGPLKAGMIVTIEPGIYLPDRKFGVRIEDDILITPRGNENMTQRIPKTVKEVEAAMK